MAPRCRRRFLPLVLLAGLCAPHPGAVATEPGSGSLEQVRLSEAWVRAMPPGRRMTAAYLRVTNEGSAALIIDAVQASRGEASLHETFVEAGQSRMRAVARLEIPAGGEIELAPGGMHIMLMGLDAAPAVGETLRLCVLAGEARACADAPVLRSAPAPAQ